MQCGVKMNWRVIEKPLYFLGVLITFSLSSFVQAKVVEAANFSEVENSFKDADDTVLGVFDIDDVLAYSTDPAFQKGNWRENQVCVKRLLKNLTPDQRWLFANYSLLQADLQPLEPNAWAAIKRIQEKKVKTIALTGSMPGLLGDIYVQEWRYHQLKKMGIDFSASFPHDPSFCMNDQCCYMGRYPAFFKGILFANGELSLKIAGCSKGEVLIEFLRREKWKPKAVIFVDDSLSNLQAMEKALSLFDPAISFVGVHFTYTPIFGMVTPEEFVSKWEKVLSLVKKHEECVPCCTIYP
jgi:hypothetical protein